MKIGGRRFVGFVVAVGEFSSFVFVMFIFVAAVGQFTVLEDQWFCGTGLLLLAGLTLLM